MTLVSEKKHPVETKHSRPANLFQVRHFLNIDQDDAFHYLNNLLKSSKTEKSNKIYWFRTPQNPGNETGHAPIQALILKEVRELEKLERLNPQENLKSRIKFFSSFDWTDSSSQVDAKQAVPALLVKIRNIFARHRFDIVVKTEFKEQLAPLDDRPTYSQNFPVPINLENVMLVALALLNKYGIITTLPCSKYESSISGKLKGIYASG